MSSAKVTLRGFMDYCEADGVDLFGGLVLPEGIEKDLVCNNILMRGGEFEVLYSSPDTMISLIAYWARRHYRTFDKWVKALNIEYEPLFNYDRTEEWTDTRESRGSSTRTDNLKDESKLHNEQTVDSEIENTRSAFDTSDYQPHDKSTTTSESSSDDTGTVTHTGTQGNVDSRDDSGVHKGHMFGNIGVTTSQRMLESELEIAKWNIYDHIADLFLQEFTIPVYV